MNETSQAGESAANAALEAAARAIYEYAPEYLHVTERDGKSYYTAWPWLDENAHQKRRCYRLAEKVIRAYEAAVVAPKAPRRAKASNSPNRPAGPCMSTEEKKGMRH